MYYLIYKTTNLLNGKFYIGKHQTKNLNDGYMGSGKYLKYAIKKYGAENFVTEILEVYDQEWKMNLAEKILVVIDCEVSYNLGPGGEGGSQFKGKTHTLETRLKIKKSMTGKKLSEEARKKIGLIHKGKITSEETRKKISLSKRKMDL